MRVELPTFSFLSVALLVSVLPGHVNFNNIPSVTIISWLFFCNLIHGVNSVLWSGNQAVHLPPWCDISSVVLLGAMVALPGAFLCVSRRLEATTSVRQTEGKHDKTHRTIFEAIMCLLFPVVFMSLHTLVQDRRFLIVKDLGCQVAVHNSVPALIIVWLPPLCISTVTILYCLSAAINVGKNRYNSRPYFPSSPEMTLSLFIRRIFFTVSGMLYIACVYVYVVSSVTSSGLLPWTSISQTRSQVARIEFVSSPSQISIQSELVWWFIPVWSLIFCLLSAVEEETRRGYRSMFAWLSQVFKRDDLPTHMRSSAKSATIPVHLLRSGWDHDLDLVSPVGSFPSISLSLFKKTGSTSSTPSPPPLEDEARFTQPMVPYLSSSTAQQLHLPPAINPQNYAPAVSPLMSIRLPEGNLTVPKAAFDVESIVSTSPTGSIFSADTWPKPPPTIPSPGSPPVFAATADPPRPSSPLSVRSSVGSTIVDALGAIPPHLRDAPFNVYGPGVAAVPISRQPRGRIEHRSPTHKGSRKNDAIYMTVVHESDVDP
ncbi:pheromone A receptor-domain-containing protein [Lactarius deliciosus]|nr:pheromone A receptor-domain-containing protein [Lactarius deliciosus]